MIVALAGRRVDAPSAQPPRFPLENVDKVAKRLRNVLADTRPSAVVCSAACGADLLALDAARDLGIRRRIVLPFDGTRFRATSVIDRPGDWGPLFDKLHEEAQAQGDLVILSYEGEDEDSYAAATERIVTEALRLAEEEADQESLGSSVDSTTAIVVWDGGSRGEGDLTAEFAALAEKSGMRIVEVGTLETRL